MIYQRTGFLAVGCIVASLLASVLYAKRLVKPILSLRQVVQQVAGGDLTVRAGVESVDELGSLALSINTMTESLRRRDLILESMGFAAQKFLSTPGWETVVDDVLAKVGEAAAVSRIQILQIEGEPGGLATLRRLHQWQNAAGGLVDAAPTPGSGSLQDAGWEPLLVPFKLGKAVASPATTLSLPAAQFLNFNPSDSFILLPIMVEKSWWGILALSDRLNKRDWTRGERDSFRAAAEMLGAAITSRKTQTALLKAKEAAEFASQTKSQFLANMSHEIRTPITGVMGMLQLLQRTKLDKRQAHYAANALTSATTLLAVIGDVLDFSKIEAGKMELHEHFFDPSQVLDTVLRLFAERAENKGIELAYRVAPSVPRSLRGDSDRLRQILVNLVGNAVKFTASGDVIVSCRRLEADSQTTTLRFEVRDTGCGISPEKQGLIFEAFSQADNSMARKYGGTGFGALTIFASVLRN
jgi:signal transduction histidine kinase/HAMP domain-containing protein